MISLSAKLLQFQVQQLPQAKFFHATAINNDILWRRNRRLPRNPTSSGPLTDLPDYSFIDGRPAPLGSHQKRRLDQQLQLAGKIVQGIHEVEFAKREYVRTLDAIEEERKGILDNKLRPKGRLLSEKV